MRLPGPRQSLALAAAAALVLPLLLALLVNRAVAAGLLPDAAGHLLGAFGTSALLLATLGWTARHLRRGSARAALLQADQQAGLDALADAMPGLLFIADAEGRPLLLNRAFRAFAGSVPDAVLAAGWQALLHPDDQPRVAAAWHQAIAGGTRFSGEFRLRRGDGQWRAFTVRAAPARDAGARILRWYGIGIDMEDRAAAERALQAERQRRELLLKEVDHRAKNALTVVQSVLRLTVAETAEGYRDAVEGRVMALARAQDLLLRGPFRVAALRPLVAAELGTFATEAANSPVRLDGPEVALIAAAAQPLAMLLHELATNAVKYGALASPGGRLLVQWRVAPEGLVLRWVESGGTAVDGPPRRRGFGSTLIANLGRQLGASLQHDWAAAGLAVTLRLPARLLAAMPGTQG